MAEGCVTGLLIFVAAIAAYVLIKAFTEILRR